jgi:N-acetylmuramoyl-L-alanine amidase
MSDDAPMALTFIDAPSPNFDERRAPVSLVVMHYTGMKDGPSALRALTNARIDPNSPSEAPTYLPGRVSSHYMVEEDGRVFVLVPEDKRAWHAGAGSWRGEQDINSRSIGIEIVNGGHDFGLPDYPDAQIRAVIELTRGILARWKLPANAVIAHSDLAPARKPDPGEKFPWARLAMAGIGDWPGPGNGDRRVLFDTEGQIDKGVAVAQAGLATIGYGVEVTGQYDKVTRDCTVAFQRRFRPANVSGAIDMETLDLIARTVPLFRR